MAPFLFRRPPEPLHMADKGDQPLSDDERNQLSIRADQFYRAAAEGDLSSHVTVTWHRSESLSVGGAS